MLTLGRDAFYQIAINVDVKDLGNLEKTCKTLWRWLTEYISNRRFWRHKGYTMNVLPKKTLVDNARLRCYSWAHTAWVEFKKENEYNKKKEYPPYDEPKWISDIREQPYKDYNDFREELRRDFMGGVIEGDQIVIHGMMRRFHIDLHDPRLGFQNESIHVDDIKDQQNALLRKQSDKDLYDESDDDSVEYNEYWRQDEALLLEAISGTERVNGSDRLTYFDDDMQDQLKGQYTTENLAHPDEYTNEDHMHDMADDIAKHVKAIPGNANSYIYHPWESEAHFPNDFDFDRRFNPTASDLLLMNTIDLQTFHQTKNLQPPDKDGYSEFFVVNP